MKKERKLLNIEVESYDKLEELRKKMGFRTLTEALRYLLSLENGKK